MSDLFTLLKKALGDFIYGVDAASAIRHGVEPTPRPADAAHLFETHMPQPGAVGASERDS